MIHECRVYRPDGTLDKKKSMTADQATRKHWKAFKVGVDGRAPSVLTCDMCEQKFEAIGRAKFCQLCGKARAKALQKKHQAARDKMKPKRYCSRCEKEIPKGRSAKTCSDECSVANEKDRALAIREKLRIANKEVKECKRSK